MARKDTNKQYSLRKLKTGTASVAVAVAVLGAGFANQTEVKAESPKSQSHSISNNERLINELTDENNELKDKLARSLDLLDNTREKDPQYRALMGENQDLREKEGKYQDKIKKLEEKEKNLEKNQKM
ncbi:TPA: YSIRK-type signal peptide-containing protein [Streptococcus pyogenes]